MKKFISFISALSLIISAMPMVSMAEVSAPVMTDACYVYSTSPETIRGGTRLQVDNSSRHSFLKFDFSGYSVEDILKIDSVTLKVRWREATYTGLTAAIMPADMEWWDSSSLSYTLANEKGLMDTSRDICLQQHTDTAAVTSSNKYITISNLQDGIVSHLLSDTDDKIVSLRLRALGGGYVLDCQSSNDEKPSLTVTANASDETYINNVASLVSFDKISPQNIYSVNQNLNLSALTLPDDVDISWSSSNPAILSNEGVVNCPVDMTPVKLTAAVSLKSNPEITAQKVFNITLDPNDGATNYYYWDFDNLGTLDTYYNSGNLFMMEYPDGSEDNYKVALADDPVATSSGNKVAKATFGKDKLLYTDELKQAKTNGNIRYISLRTDALKSASGVFHMDSRINSSTSAWLWGLTNDFSVNNWYQFRTVVDVTTGNTKVQKMAPDGWESYSISNTVDTTYNTADNWKAVPWERLMIKTDGSTGDVYFDNISIKGYQDLYLEVNAATEGNVLAVLEAFDNMQIIELPAGYAEADKTVLASLIKSKNYTSDDEVMVVLERALSTDEIIISAETKADNKLTSVKFVTKENVSDVNVSFIAASYTSDNTLVAVSIAPVASVAFDTWNTITDINLDIKDAACIKYMIWDSVENSCKPLAKSTIK